MAYDIDLTPKVVDDGDLDNLEERIKKIEEHGVEIKAKDDQGFTDLKDKIKEIEEKGINLNVTINADNDKSSKEIAKDNAAISKLIQQLNTLAKFDGSQLIKTIDITFDIKNLTKEISDALSAVNNLKPNIAISTQDIEQRFKELRKLYNEQVEAYDSHTKPMAKSSWAKNDIVGYKVAFDEAIDKANQLYNTCQSIDYLLSKDETLETRLGFGKAYYSVEDTLEGFEGDFAVFAEYLSMTDKQIEKTMNSIIGKKKELSDQDVFNTGTTQQIQAKTKNTGKSLEDLGDQTESFIERFQKAITKLHTEMSDLNTEYIGPMATNIKKLKTILDEMNQAVQQIKSPFDETSISNTATRLEELFKQYNSLDGTEKEMKIGVEISPEDEKKLQDVAKYADDIKSAMRNITTYKAINSGNENKGNTKPTTPKSNGANKPSKEPPKEDLDVITATNKAIEAYEELVPKEVKITLKVENFKDLQTAIGYIKEIDKRNKKIAEDTVTPVKPKIQSGVFKPSNNQNNSTSNNGNGGNNKPVDPDVSAKLQTILAGENSIHEKLKEVVTKLESINKKIPSAENLASLVATTKEQVQTTSGINESEKNPPGNNGGGQDNNNETLRTIGDEVRKSTNLMSQAVDEFHSFCQRFLRRFPVSQNNTSTSAANSGSPNNNNGDNESGKQSLITTLIDPKLTAIQTHLSNIENKVTRDGNASKGSDDATAPPASSDVKNINTNVGTISTTVKTIGDKVAEISKKIGTSSKSKSESKGKDNTTSIKDKLNNLPTVLNSIKQTNASTSKNTKAIQTNTGNISTKVGQVRDTIKSKADAIAGQLSSIDTHILQGNAPSSPDVATKNDYAALESAIKTLTQTLQTPTTTGNAQNVQNNATAPSPAQAAANLANVSNLQTQATNRIKELQTVLGFMNNGTFSNIFGSTQDIQSYITSIETLNKEIASAGKLLNRNDISATQRSNAEKKLSTDTAVLNGYINGDDSLNISTSQIANINALLHGMETINSRITGTDAALEGLKRLKDTLDSYNITVQPLNDAINGLKGTRNDLKQMADKLSDSSLTEGELANLQNSITAAEQSYQDVINKSNDLLNTNQKNSLQSITNEFQNAQREVNKYSSKIESLKNLLQDLKAKNINLNTINMGNGKTAQDMEAFIKDYEKFLSTGNKIANSQDMQTFASSFEQNYQTPLKQYINNLGEAKRQFKDMTNAASQSIQGSNFNKQLADFTTSVEKWKKANSSAFSYAEYKNTYNKILSELTSGTVQSTERLAQLRTEFAQLKLRVNQASLATKSFTVKLKEMFKKYGGWTLVTRTLNTAMRLIRSMVTQVKELDTSMTNLRKVTEATGNQLNTFLESAGKRSVSLGASLTDYVDAVSEFSRLGKSLDEAQKLGELATTYKTVAEDLDIKTASKSIISTMQAFNSVGVQADEIVDKFNYVGNNFAASSAEIGESLQRSAAALNGAQNTLSESIGLTVSAQTIVQNAETVGTALKTISARIRGTTSELGDEAEDLTVTTSKLQKEIKALSGVDIMDKGRYKSTYQILKEIAEVYNTLDSGSQARINELLGGKVGINTIQAILQNFETAKKIVEELDTGLAKGSATKELERSLDSIQGKLNQLKSNWQQFSSDFLGTGMIKGAVDLLKGLVSTLDKLTKSAKGFGLAITAAMASLSVNRSVRKSSIGGNIFGFTGFENGLRNGKFGFMTGIQPESLMDLSSVNHQFSVARVAKNKGRDLDSIPALSAQMKEFTKNTDAANWSVSNFYATQTKSAKGFLGSIQAIKTYNNINKSNISQRKAFADAVAISNAELGKQMQQLQGANANAITYFKTIKIGVKELAGKAFNMFTSGLLSLGISVAIGALIKGIQYLTESYDRMLEKNAELSKSFKEITDEYKDGSDEINSLMTQYANIIVTTSDLSTAQSELIDIQEQLAEALGIEKDKLDLVGGSYAENIKLIQKLRKESAKAFADESHNQEQYEAAKNRLTESALARHQEGGFVYSDKASQITAKGYGDWDDDITAARIINQYSNAGLSPQANRLIVGGTIDEQIETLEAINDELTKLWKNKPSDANERAWLNAIQERIDTLKEEKTTAEELIKIYEDSEAVRDSNISDNIYSKIADAEEIIEKLQTATNAKEIIELSNAYRQLKNEIYSSADSNDTVALDIFNSFFDTVEKNIDQRILDINNKTTVLENAFKKFQDETYDKFTNKLSKLDSAIKTVSAGDFIDESSMNELIKMDAATLDDFQKTANGYTISLDNLLKIRKRLINEQREDISDTLDEEKTLYANQLAQIEQLKKDYAINRDKKTRNDLEALKKQAEETNKRIKAYQAWDKMVSENLLQLEDEIYEKVTSKISKIDSAIKTISTGEYMDASALLELIKLDSSLAGQFKQTIEGYTLSLDTLYEIRKKLISDQEQDIKKQIEENKKYIEEQQTILTQARAKLYDERYSDKSRYDAGTQAQQAQQEINQTQERIELLETYLDLVGRGTDKISLFQQAISDVKGFRDNISALYSDEGLDDQFFIDHPELLRYRNDISALAEEIQKLANAKASPVIEQLRAAMNESLASGDFDGARKYNSMIEQLTKAADQSNLNMLEKQKKKIREQVEEKERYIKKLERQKDKEQKILDKLNKQKEALEKQEEKYQTANKTAQDYIDELIKSLEKETDALEENKQAIEDNYDARIQAIKDAIEAIDNEAEAIDKEAEAQERLNDLKEKEFALEKARNTKVRVYDKTYGWTIQSDSEAIAEAQKDYDDALKDYNKWKQKEEDDARKAELQAQIDALEAEKEAALAAIDQQISAIEAQKQEFEDYKQLWEDTLNAYQKMQDQMTAAAILGSDWREKLAQKDTDIVNKFAEEYKKIESELHGVVEKKIEKLDKVIEKYDEEITKQNDLKSAQESYLSYYETYSKKFVDLTDAQTEALEKLKKALNLGDSEAALDAVVKADEAFGTDKSKNDTKLSSRYQLMDMYTRLMQTAPTALIDGLRSNFEVIKNLPNTLKTALSSVNTNNNVTNDNRNQSININNPGFALTMAEFMPLLTSAFAQLNKESQIGKK